MFAIERPDRSRMPHNHVELVVAVLCALRARASLAVARVPSARRASAGLHLAHIARRAEY